MTTATRKPEVLAISLAGERMVLDQVCGECNGDKQLYSAAWKAWNKRYDDAMADLRNRGEATFGDALLDRAAEIAGPEPAEPEEYLCPECEGVGFVLTDAGREIRRFMVRHGGAR